MEFISLAIKKQKHMGLQKRMFKYTNSPTNDKQRLFSTYHYSIGHCFYGNS